MFNHTHRQGFYPHRTPGRNCYYCNPRRHSPVVAHAREKARQSTCTSNQRQIAAAMLMYAQDHDETLPETATVWQDYPAGNLLCFKS